MLIGIQGALSSTNELAFEHHYLPRVVPNILMTESPTVISPFYRALRYLLFAGDRYESQIGETSGSKSSPYLV